MDIQLTSQTSVGHPLDVSDVRWPGMRYVVALKPVWNPAGIHVDSTWIHESYGSFVINFIYKRIWLDYLKFAYSLMLYMYKYNHTGNKSNMFLVFFQMRIRMILLEVYIQFQSKFPMNHIFASSNIPSCHLACSSLSLHDSKQNMCDSLILAKDCFDLIFH